MGFRPDRCVILASAGQEIAMATPTIALQARSLTKRFGTLMAVTCLNLEVWSGEIFGFLGPNGAGKTTAIHMLCGLLQPDEGDVWIQGRPAHSDARLQVGICPQSLVFWPTLTCIEQLELIGATYDLPWKEARARGERLLEAMGLAEKRDTLGKALSGGMQRRLNLALALVHDPEILILDEPEAGLDPQSRILVREYIRSLAGRKTIILTTHNMDEADRLADRIAILDRGRLLRLDSAEALKRSVGEGDVLEIGMNGGLVDVALARLRGLSLEVQGQAGMVTLRGRGLVERLPEILGILREENVQPGEVRLRPNTLEDVFIALTGRNLRE